ncbi:MAG: hypothetical protein CM1200mP15_08480 [Dehalococcoidia bacterium]|nr:MAG: hypothetical protein CM1200mP15_08480 [Dehalococcoidia bacterium]
MGDAADGIPGIPKWGAKTASTVLKRYTHIEAIPESHLLWDVEVRGAKTVAENLVIHKTDAFLYRELATLCVDVPILESMTISNGWAQTGQNMGNSVMIWGSMG